MVLKVLKKPKRLVVLKVWQAMYYAREQLPVLRELNIGAKQGRQSADEEVVVHQVAYGG